MVEPPSRNLNTVIIKINKRVTDNSAGSCCFSVMKLTVAALTPPFIGEHGSDNQRNVVAASRCTKCPFDLFILD